MGLQGVVQTGKTQTIIGRLRYRVQIVQPTLAQGSAGGFNLNQNTVLLTCWGGIEALTASEKFAAHEFVSQVTHKIWVRHPRSSMTDSIFPIQPKMQVWFNTRQFQIEGVLNPNERPDLLLLMCIEINSSKNQPSASPKESAL